MKKLFILLFVFLFAFTLTACSEDTTLQDSIDELTLLIEGLEDDKDALETSVADLEAELAALNTADGVQDGLLDELLAEDLPFLKQTEIIITHTNDVHGRVNDDSWSGTMGMATVKNLIDEIEGLYDNTFLVSAGDIFHGTTFATLEEGESVLNVMNFVGYDLLVPGNHDFDYGQDRLLELEALANFPLVSANIQYALDDEDMFEPYIIQEFEGVKVGFFGLTSPETTYKTHPDNVVGLNFLDPIAQAAAMVEELEPLVDVIILVAHVGLDASTTVTTEDIVLAVDGIDVVIDGHSHSTLENGMWVNDTLIVSTGEYMKNLGVLSIVVQGGQIIARNSTLISSAEAAEYGYGADQDVQDYIDAIVADQAVILDVVVGQTAVELMGERGDVRTGETNLGNLITDSMIDVTDADIAITNGGGIRASIPVGDITVGDIITVLPFGNIIVTKDLTGAAILAALEHGTSSYPDASGAFPHVAGLTFEINTLNPEGSRVQNVLVDGVALDLEGIYTVATNDFLAAGGDDYTMFLDFPTAGEFMGLHEALTTKFTVDVDVEMPVMGRITTVVTPPVFFSQYGDGDGGSCKFIELYNPTDAAIDLSNFKIIKGGNGTTFEDSTDIELLTDIILDAGAVLIVGNPACFTGLDPSDDFDFPLSGIDYIESTVVGYINGNDALGLFYFEVLVDTIGLSGEDAIWDVGNGDLLGGTTENSGMIRVPTVEGGEADWSVAAMQWIVIDDRDYTDVGLHTHTPAS